MIHDNGDITYREWAPNAVEASLIGDFSMMPFRVLKAEDDVDGRAADDWHRDATPMKKNEFGVWEVGLPAADGRSAIPHDSKVKVRHSSKGKAVVPE